MNKASTPNIQLPTPKSGVLGIGSWGLGIDWSVLVLGPAACIVFAAVAFAQSSGASVWGGVFTEEQVKRGAASYQRECSNCHGVALEGGDMTPPLVGGGFTSNWNDLTLGDLSERIRLTMPLDSPGKLSRQQNVDVIAFILKTNEWPSGTTELPLEVGALKQIKIQATK